MEEEEENAEVEHDEVKVEEGRMWRRGGGGSRGRGMWKRRRKRRYRMIRSVDVEEDEEYKQRTS